MGDALVAARQGHFLYKGCDCDQLLGEHRMRHSLDQCWELDHLSMSLRQPCYRRFFATYELDQVPVALC